MGELFALAEAAVKAGWACGPEHTQLILECFPTLAFLSLPELLNLEKPASAVRPLFDQCSLRGLARKPTEVSGNLKDLTRLNAFTCPGSFETHVHRQSHGKKAGGGFIRGSWRGILLICVEY